MFGVMNNTALQLCKIGYVIEESAGYDKYYNNDCANL